MSNNYETTFPKISDVTYNKIPKDSHKIPKSMMNTIFFSWNITSYESRLNLAPN